MTWLMLNVFLNAGSFVRHKKLRNELFFGGREQFLNFRQSINDRRCHVSG